jgi:hypothetical protein
MIFKLEYKTDFNKLVYNSLKISEFYEVLLIEVNLMIKRALWKSVFHCLTSDNINY